MSAGGWVGLSEVSGSRGRGEAGRGEEVKVSPREGRVPVLRAARAAPLLEYASSGRRRNPVRREKQRRGGPVLPLPPSIVHAVPPSPPPPPFFAISPSTTSDPVRPSALRSLVFLRLSLSRARCPASSCPAPARCAALPDLGPHCDSYLTLMSQA